MDDSDKVEDVMKDMIKCGCKLCMLIKNHPLPFDVGDSEFQFIRTPRKKGTIRKKDKEKYK